MIRVFVQDENGREVSEAIDVSAALIARPGDLRFTCLRFVDPYGDTVFNHLQLPSLRDDIRLLEESHHNSGHEALFREMEMLIERCQTEPHLYLKLVGD